MPEPILIGPAHPADLSPAERTRAVAAILAAGLLRLLKPVTSPDSLPLLASENSPESSVNELAVWAEKSVTVHAG